MKLLAKVTKSLAKYFIAPAAIAIALVYATGCATDSYARLLTAQTIQTNQVTQHIVLTQTNTVIETNIVVQTNVVQVLNGVTETNEVEVTNQVNEVIPVTVTNVSYSTNNITVTNGWQVSNLASNVLGAASIVNSVSSPINPWAGLVGLIITGAGGGLAWFARLKSQQAAQHLSTATTMITAIEGLAPVVSAGVKAAVAAQALKQGTTNEVNATVQAVVNALPAAPPVAAA